MSTTTKEAEVWLRTGPVCVALGISRDTLRRRRKEGYFKETKHFTKSGPTVGKSWYLWNLGECRKVFGTWKAPKKDEG